MVDQRAVEEPVDRSRGGPRRDTGQAYDCLRASPVNVPVSPTAPPFWDQIRKRALHERRLRRTTAPPRTDPGSDVVTYCYQLSHTVIDWELAGDGSHVPSRAAGDRYCASEGWGPSRVLTGLDEGDPEHVFFHDAPAA